jgi:hypothetical protein
MNSKHITLIVGAFGVIGTIFQPASAVSNAPPPAKIITVKPAESITPEMKANLEAAIQTCEKQTADSKKLIDRFDEVNKPSPQASSAEKDRYKNLDLYKRFFESQFGEFAEFANDKFTLRGITEAKKLLDSQAEFTRKCQEYSEFLKGFVDWAIVGKAPAGMDVNYQQKIDAFKSKT